MDWITPERGAIKTDDGQVISLKPTQVGQDEYEMLWAGAQVEYSFENPEAARKKLNAIRLLNRKMRPKGPKKGTPEKPMAAPSVVAAVPARAAKPRRSTPRKAASEPEGGSLAKFILAIAVAVLSAPFLVLSAVLSPLVELLEKKR